MNGYKFKMEHCYTIAMIVVVGVLAAVFVGVGILVALNV